MKKLFFTLILSAMSVFLFAQFDKNYGDTIFQYSSKFPGSEYKIVKIESTENDFDTWFMPGLAYSYYQPKLSDSIGFFSGLAVEYLIYAKVAQNDNPGPSHVRIYSKLNILKSSEANISSLFMYSLGLGLSLEKNPKRTFLVPYFGLEFGGMSQKEFGKSVQFTPTFGIHILSRKNIFINIHGGYVYPIRNFETLQGWFGEAGLNFALW
jgi:hypothetical protein